MKRVAVALIDGEHYPAVVADALQQTSDRFDYRAALFLGGTEKIKSSRLVDDAPALYGLPVVFDTDPLRGLRRAIDEFRPEVVVDLSDEPVVGYVERFRLISESLARGVGYLGSDFHISPASSARLCTSPSLSIIGTGKRVGKTAISGYVARALQKGFTGQEGGPAVVIVAMGRGGPAEPEIIHGTEALTVEDLLVWNRQGRHAASDHFEDALVSRVTTIGTRRCGGGLAGRPFVSNLDKGVELANRLHPGLVILEGSGAAVPQVRSDARLLVASGHQPVEHVAGYLGTYRLLISDGLVLTMAEEPLASPRKVRAMIDAVSEIRPDMTVVPVVFRPRPLEDVRGRRVAFFSTAPAGQQGVLRDYLEEYWGCNVELMSTCLADRAALRADLDRPEMSRVDTVLTEIKAAAIDVVAEVADARGLAVVAVDNVPVEAIPARPGSLAELVEELGKRAKDRFESGV